MQNITKNNKKLKLTTQTVTVLKETLTEDQLKAVQGAGGGIGVSNNANC